MDYKELMAKIKRGEALTQEEIADFDREFRPTYRFNEVSQKRANSNLKSNNDRRKRETQNCGNGSGTESARSSQCAAFGAFR